MKMDLMGTLRFAHPTCLNQSGIHVAEYLTALPTREILKEKLHKAIEISRQRLEQRKRSSEEQE